MPVQNSFASLLCGFCSGLTLAGCTEFGIERLEGREWVANFCSRMHEQFPLHLQRRRVRICTAVGERWEQSSQNECCGFLVCVVLWWGFGDCSVQRSGKQPHGHFRVSREPPSCHVSYTSKVTLLRAVASNHRSTNLDFNFSNAFLRSSSRTFLDAFFICRWLHGSYACCLAHCVLGVRACVSPQRWPERNMVRFFWCLAWRQCSSPSPFEKVHCWETSVLVSRDFVHGQVEMGPRD